MAITAYLSICLRLAGFTTLLFAVVLLGLFVTPTKLHAASQESIIKAAFIEKLTRFIAWPGQDIQTSDDPFQLCVINEDSFDGALDRLASVTQVKGRILVIQYLKSIKAIKDCDVLFISGSMSKRLDAVLMHVRGRPVLTIGDTDGYADRGVMVNFFVDEGKLRFEINHKAAMAAKIKVGSRVMKLARLVDGKG